MLSKIKPAKDFEPGRLLRKNGFIRIVRFLDLPDSHQATLFKIFQEFKYSVNENLQYFDKDVEFSEDNLPYQDIARSVKSGILDLEKLRYKYNHEEVNFENIKNKALGYADFIESKKQEIREALRDYETKNVVDDEIARSVELLRNLDKNKEYFCYFAPAIASFLPLNQPLYAIVCFGIVPSLQCREVFIRPPKFAHETFEKLQNVLEIKNSFKNLHISYGDRESFVNSTKKRVEGVIFVGSDINAQIVRRLYPNEIMFLSNGSGHNPLVISKDADIERALDSILSVCLYNQGQDCCGPNSILVDKEIQNEIINCLVRRLKSIEGLVGTSQDDKNIVGPNTDKSHVSRIAEVFSKAANYHVYGGDINPITGMIKPTVFLKPLACGGNYEEFFAPVFFIQPYDNEDELKQYFADERYKKHAMYVSIFGNSSIEDFLIKAGLHNSSNILKNTDLHKEEKGFLPYGGLGESASCIYYSGKKRPSAILPQREIYNYLVKNLQLD